jgi:OmpA-OmpF porin, OOP family
MKILSRLLLYFSFSLFANYAPSQNLIPNPSFEELRNLPVKPNPKRSFMYEPKSGYIPYQKNLNHWFAATKTSPDLRIHNQERYNECRRKFKNCDKAHSGENCVGIITYMGNIKTDTYREYIQVKLKKNLRPKVKTYIEFWISKEREAKLVSNNIGLHFSMKKTTVNTMETLNLIPQVNYDSFVNSNKKEWVKIQRSFTPDLPFIYLLIGNFYRNDQTKVQEFQEYNGSPYIPPYAYYLIDDIRIWQEGDQEETKPLVFENKVIEFNEPIQLNNITFEYDSSVLQDPSYIELEKLLLLLKDNPKIEIEIHGHTDNHGDDDYNLTLSKKRAKAVLTYLMMNGIDKARLTSQGFGEKKPIKGNETNEGRRQNRRVEFSVRVN